MKVFVLLLLVAAASSTVIDTRYCDNSNLAVCEIHEIRLEPCPVKSNCKVVRGADAEIWFDFTPHFTTSSLTTQVSCQGSVWPDLDADGCKATTCPTVAGTMQTYNAKLHIGKKIPKGTFTFDWSVTDATNATNTCCIRATVKVEKK